MTWTASTTSTGTGKDSDSDEAADKGQIEYDPYPAEPFGSTVLQEELHDHGNQGVCDGGSKDTFDCAIGSTGALNSTVDLVETGREQAERDD